MLSPPELDVGWAPGPAGQRCPTIPRVSDGSHAQSMDVVKRFLLGRALATSQADHQLLPKLLALPVFSSDALSSVAYATEEMMLVLVAAGSGALSAKLPLALAIAAAAGDRRLVVPADRQGLSAGRRLLHRREGEPGNDPRAGRRRGHPERLRPDGRGERHRGDHRRHLGRSDVRRAQGPHRARLHPADHAREPPRPEGGGKIFALPTYGFIAMIGVMLVVGALRCVVGCPCRRHGQPSTRTDRRHHAVPDLARSRRVPRRSQASRRSPTASRRSGRRRRGTRPRPSPSWASIGVTMFLGITLLAQALHIRVNADIAVSRSVLSQIAETVFGRTWAFFLLQGSPRAS